MKQLLILIALFVGTSAFSETWTGYLVDKMCSKRITNAARGASHTKECLTEEHCAKSGYGIAVDGVWYKFDKKGDELAAALLKATTREKGIKIQVTGTMKKKQIKVSQIVETN